MRTKTGNRRIGRRASDGRENTIVIGSAPEDYGAGRQFVEDLLTRSGLSGEIIRENLLVFETIFNKLSEQYRDAPVQLTISGHRGLDVKIKITFEGKMAILEGEDGRFSPEDRILEAFADKLDFHYHLGFNRISLSVSRNYRRAVLVNLLAPLLAVLIGFPISLAADADGVAWFIKYVTIPVENLFINAVLMLAAPVTFFSLLKNITDLYITRERNKGVGRLQKRVLLSSARAVVIAACLGLAIVKLFGGTAIPAGFFSLQARTSFLKAGFEFIASSILQPFENLSPFPLLLLAFLTAYAFCSVGKHFDRIKAAVDACYTLFSKMLGMVIYLLPVFSFLVFLDNILLEGFYDLPMLAAVAAAMAIGSVLLCLFYVLGLRAKGIRGLRLLSDLKPLLLENLSMGSAIDAVPFNTRFCARNLGIDRKRLQDSLPVLAQLNLDGNCLVLTLISVLVLAISTPDFTVMDLALIGILVLFLSLGAPGQPGSCLIGLVVILNFLDAKSVLELAIVGEALFGWLQNTINVLGDIVIVAQISPPHEKYRIGKRA